STTNPRLVRQVVANRRLPSAWKASARDARSSPPRTPLTPPFEQATTTILRSSSPGTARSCSNLALAPHGKRENREIWRKRSVRRQAHLFPHTSPRRAARPKRRSGKAFPQRTAALGRPLREASSERNRSTRTTGGPFSWVLPWR